MKLNLQKPLVIFDLETTGLDLVKDRIIQRSYIKVYPDGREERGDELVNPECIIPAEVEQLTGITNDDVKDKPTFKQLAQKLSDNFTGCDFAGFNSNHFDIPLLAEEFLRAGIDFDFQKCRLIDAQTISTRWNGVTWLLPTSSTAGGRWKTTSRPTVPTRIRRLRTAC